jgi:hypothetical protein
MDGEGGREYLSSAVVTNGAAPGVLGRFRRCHGQPAPYVEGYDYKEIV